MDPHTFGRFGEDLAARFLERSGWSVVARNYRFGRKEVDLIATRGDVLAFIEVKSRTGTEYGHPIESITRRKRGEIMEVARAWLRKHPQRGKILRFDAVAVHSTLRGPPRVEHFEDAWRPGF